jgi:hypothetical protein
LVLEAAGTIAVTATTRVVASSTGTDKRASTFLFDDQFRYRGTSASTSTHDTM